MAIRSITYPPPWSHGALGAGRFSRGFKRVGQTFSKGFRRLGRGVKKLATSKAVQQVGKQLGNQIVSSGIRTASQILAGQDPKTALLENTKSLASNIRDQAVDAGLQAFNQQVVPALKRKLPKGISDEAVDAGVQALNKKVVPVLKRKLLGDESFSKKKKLFN